MHPGGGEPIGVSGGTYNGVWPDGQAFSPDGRRTRKALAALHKTMQKGQGRRAAEPDGNPTMTSRLLSGMAMLMCVAGTSVGAQTRDGHTTGRDIKIETPRKQPTPGGSKSCPEYGPGFVRVEGTSSCVRIGGGISVEGGARGR
jgi:hypothetical protein